MSARRDSIDRQTEQVSEVVFVSPHLVRSACLPDSVLTDTRLPNIYLHYLSDLALGRSN